MKIEERYTWLDEDKLPIILCILRENYPHCAVLVGKDEKSFFIANTHRVSIERFDGAEFIDRFYMHLRYIEGIQWKKGHHHLVMDRLIRWEIHLAKIFKRVIPGTVYILEEKT